MSSPSELTPAGRKPKKRAAKPGQKKMVRRNRPLTNLAVRRYLEALAKGETNRSAAAIAGHAPQRFYELRRKDEEFAEAWKLARNEGADYLEEKLARRIDEGYEEIHRDGDGNVVRRVNRYYPQDLHIALRAARPESYRDNYVPPQMQVNVGVLVEDRSASLADVLAVLTAAGVADQLGGSVGPEMAGPRELLAAPPDGQR